MCKISKVIEVFQRYKKAVNEGKGNIVENYSSIESYLKERCEDRLYTTLLLEAQYIAIKYISKHKVRVKDVSPTLEWNGIKVKEGCKLVETIINANRAGDFNARDIQLYRLNKLLYGKSIGNGSKLYIIKCWLEKDTDLAREQYDWNSKYANEILSSNSEDRVEEVLDLQYRDINVVEGEKKSSIIEKRKGYLMTTEDIEHFVHDAYYAVDKDSIYQLIEELNSKWFDSGDDIDYYRNVSNYLNKKLEELGEASNNDNDVLPPSPLQEAEIDELIVVQNA